MERVEPGPVYIQLSPEMMPLRIYATEPFDAPRKGSPAQARRAMVEGFSRWERAIRPQLDWFALEFVERARDADLRVDWTRTTSSPGKARTICEPVTPTDPARPRVRCRIEVAIGRQPKALSMGGALQDTHVLEERRSVRELINLAAHEFGHALGLRDCACNSVMDYSGWRYPEADVTDLDVRNLLARID